MHSFVGDIIQHAAVLALAGRRAVIVHQVNCQRTAGTGLALSIRQRWPHWYAHYIQVEPHLGHADLFRVEPHIAVASLFAQDRYGRNARYTDEAAFELCLASLRPLIAPTTTILFPCRIGCGNGGGDWATILPLIVQHFPDAALITLPS